MTRCTPYLYLISEPNSTILKTINQPREIKGGKQNTIISKYCDGTRYQHKLPSEWDLIKWVSNSRITVFWKIS